MKRLLLVIIAFIVICTMDYNDAKTEQSYYCEMVKTYKQTNGENGWPDYNKTYETECKQ